MLEIVGEAASRVTADVRTRHDQIPWTDIVGVRNRLIHGYDSEALHGPGPVRRIVGLRGQTSRGRLRASSVVFLVGQQLLHGGS